MSDKKNNQCIVITDNGEIKGSIGSEYEEIEGQGDGAISAVVDLDNGQTITVKMSEISEQ